MTCCIFMFHIIIGHLLWTTSPISAQSEIDQYGSDYFKMSDRSAIKLCMLLDGAYSWVEPQDETRGAKCSFEAKVWTADNKHAKEFCASKVPFYITNAESDASTGRTRCTFQVNLKCADAWVQIKNRCYKTTSVKFDQTQLNETCTPYVPATNSTAKLATVYSTNLLPFFEELLPEITTAWVQVSDMDSYFENVNATDDKAVIVMNGHLYDVAAGSLVLDPPERRHRVICEYSPAITMAEIVYLAQQYDTIYPLFITSDGASFSTASYATVTHSGGSQYDTTALDDQCKAIGNIFGVESNTYFSREKPFEDIKDRLANHAFHLTSGVKNDDCKLSAYHDGNGVNAWTFPGNISDGYCDAHSLSFNKGGRFPMKAAMRAPVLCNFEALVNEYGDCEQDWITWIRAGNVIYCHKWIEKILHVDEARKECSNLGAQLTGFDSAEEVRHVMKNTGGDSHYTVGGMTPCGDIHACWEDGAAGNNALIEQYKYTGIWQKGSDSMTVSHDFEFHTHTKLSIWALCGKTGVLNTKKKSSK